MLERPTSIIELNFPHCNIYCVFYYYARASFVEFSPLVKSVLVATMNIKIDNLFKMKAKQPYCMHNINEVLCFDLGSNLPVLRWTRKTGRCGLCAQVCSGSGCGHHLNKLSPSINYCNCHVERNSSDMKIVRLDDI